MVRNTSRSTIRETHLSKVIQSKLQTSWLWIPGDSDTVPSLTSGSNTHFRFSRVTSGSHTSRPCRCARVAGGVQAAAGPAHGVRPRGASRHEPLRGRRDPHGRRALPDPRTGTFESRHSRAGRRGWGEDVSNTTVAIRLGGFTPNTTPQQNNVRLQTRTAWPAEKSHLKFRVPFPFENLAGIGHYHFFRK